MLTACRVPSFLGFSQSILGGCRFFLGCPGRVEFSHGKVEGTVGVPNLILRQTHMAMGFSKSKARTPREHQPIPTTICSKIGGEFTYQPKWDPKTVLTTTAIFVGFLQLSVGVSRCFAISRAFNWAKSTRPIYLYVVFVATVFGSAKGKLRGKPKSPEVNFKGLFQIHTLEAPRF